MRDRSEGIEPVRSYWKEDFSRAYESVLVAYHVDQDRKPESLGVYLSRAMLTERLSPDELLGFQQLIENSSDRVEWHYLLQVSLGLGREQNFLKFINLLEKSSEEEQRLFFDPGIAGLSLLLEDPGEFLLSELFAALRESGISLESVSELTPQDFSNSFTNINALLEFIKERLQDEVRVQGRVGGGGLIVEEFEEDDQEAKQISASTLRREFHDGDRAKSDMKESIKLVLEQTLGAMRMLLNARSSAASQALLLRLRACRRSLVRNSGPEFLEWIKALKGNREAMERALLFVDFLNRKDILRRYPELNPLSYLGCAAPGVEEISFLAPALGLELEEFDEVMESVWSGFRPLPERFIGRPVFDWVENNFIPLLYHHLDSATSD